MIKFYAPALIQDKKYVGVSKSPFERRIDSIVKKAAIIEKEVWVYGINSTLSGDIVAAVKIASEWHDVSPQSFMRNIYVKNLNAEDEHTMSNPALIQANKKLYTDVSLAIQAAAKILKVSGEIDFWIMSNNLNPKIPKSDLHDALRQGGAAGVAVAKRKYRYTSGSNDGLDARLIVTNLHLGKFKV